MRLSTQTGSVTFVYELGLSRNSTPTASHKRTHRQPDTCSAAFIWKWLQHAAERATPCRMRSSERGHGARQPCRSLPLRRQTWPALQQGSRTRELLQLSTPSLLLHTREGARAQKCPCLTSVMLLDSSGFTFYRAD